MSEADKQEKTVQNDELTVYEISFLLMPTIAENMIGEEFAAIKNSIERRDATFISEDAPKMIRLAYTMAKRTAGARQKVDTAYFGWVKFELDPAHINEIKDEIKTLPNVLRFLVIKTVREKTMTSREDRMPKSEPAPSPSALPAQPQEQQDRTRDRIVVSKEELDKEIEDLVID